MNTSILIIYLVLLIIRCPWKDNKQIIISIFNELCVVAAYAASVILAYFDYSNKYNNINQRNNMGRIIMYAS